MIAAPPFFSEYQAIVDRELSRLVPAGPDPVQRSMAYTLHAPSKRVRPVLAMLASELCGGSARQALPATDAADAMLALQGEQTRPGVALTGRTPDVMPTLLHALGVPISRELAGSALTGLFSDAFMERYPVRRVARYARPSHRVVERSGQPLDQEMIDRLRSLRYLR